MDQITFEQLPILVGEIRDRLARIEKNLGLLSPTETQDTRDSLMTISEASLFLNLAKSTIYGLVCRMEIPVSKRGKRLYFDKAELLGWVKKGRKKTNEEIQNEADDYLKKYRAKKF